MEFVFFGAISIRFHLREISPLRLQVDGGAHLEVRTCGIAFREEYMERIFYAFGESKRIQVDSPFDWTVATANIHYQAVIDIHPHVVIAAEFKILTLHILELGRNLHGETVIVLLATSSQLVVPVKLRILYRLRGIEIFQVIDREKSAIFVRLRNVGEPETFLVQGQVDIAANSVGILLTGRIGRHHLRNKPLLDFVGSRAFAPRIHQGINAGRQTIHQGILHHAGYKPLAALVFNKFARRILNRYRRVFVAIVNATEIHILAKVRYKVIRIGTGLLDAFASPVYDQRRNFHRGANTEYLRVRRRNAERNRGNPSRIGFSENRIQFNQLTRNGI